MLQEDRDLQLCFYAPNLASRFIHDQLICHNSPGLVPRACNSDAPMNVLGGPRR